MARTYQPTQANHNRPNLRLLAGVIFRSLKDLSGIGNCTLENRFWQLRSIRDR
jgi:hypothetical protein